jgi:[histone H3]-lysine36 N-dimethyltransferase SETMAR
MEKENLRAYIKVRAALGIEPIVISKELNDVFKDQAPSYSTVARWCKLFREGRDSLEDDPRSGRPISETVPANIERVRHVIDEDPFSTYDDIQAETSLCRNTIQHIIHDHLKLRKITSRWVPHELSVKNRNERVRICKENLAKFEEDKWRVCDIITGDESWFYHRRVGRKQSNASWVAEGQNPRTVVRQGRYEPKTMFTIFFRTTGVVHISYLDEGKTIDHKTYINSCIKPIIKILNKQRPTLGCKNLKFHHDNAKPHVHKSVITCLKTNNFIIMEQPPYSPDLAPSDFWLFDYIKQRLQDHSSAQSLANQISEIVKAIPLHEFKKTFEKWLERMRLCIKHKGDYFEHLQNK